MYLLLAKGHALARRAREGFQAIVSDAVTGRYPLIILEGQREDQRFRAAFERLHVPFNVGLEVSTIDTLKYYVARGMGIAVISGFSVIQEDRTRLEVVKVPDDVGGSGAQPVASAVPMLDGSGAQRYTLAFLAAGAYTVAFTCQAALDAPATDDAIMFAPVVAATVTANASTTLDLHP